MATPVHAASQPRILRIFVSYASEDLKLANAIASGFRKALGESPFAEINFDRWSLQAGEEFRKQLAAKLAQSDILIIVYTGVDKHSHGFTGWEVGFFEGGMNASSEQKRIIPMFLQAPPDSVSGYQGVSLNIPHPLLRLSCDDFAAQNTVDADDAMCVLIADLQDTVDDYTKKAGLAPNRGKPDPRDAVRDMRLEIFRYLKTTVEVIVKPQKQITIRSAGITLREGDAELPSDAKLIPVGNGSPLSSIFGLPDMEMTWRDFLSAIDARQKLSWPTAMTSVVTSSLNRINIDNSQIILSANDLVAYRIILTTATRYFDGTQEFNLHFVEALQREEYGDHDTTLLLKGLELVCRFRFMFLEEASKFSSYYISMMTPETLPGTAVELLRELNLMRKDSLNAGLDKAPVWTRFVDWNLIVKMAEGYEPAEKAIRQLIAEILKSKDKPDSLLALRANLSASVKNLADITRPFNTQLIQAMADRLRNIVEPHKG